MLSGATPLRTMSAMRNDDARLARARARQDEHRAVDRFNGLALLRIQRVQVHHARGV
jgi:hypothetical protein